MKEKYVVTYRPGGEDKIICKIMNGIELSTLYGFCDCSGDVILHVYMLTYLGYLFEVDFEVPDDPPFNRMIIRDRDYGVKIAEYTWHEH